MEDITREICKRNGIVPVRSKGQNFLIKEAVYDKIIKTAELKKGDRVIEVGPGLGFLTEKLAFNAKKVVAIELDKKLAELVNERMKSHNISKVQVVNEDVLDILSQNNSNSKFCLPNSNYKIVANLPYNITSVFLRKVYELENKPESMVLLLQKEVAERIAAGPGEMSKLSVMCQFYAKPEIIMPVPSQAFWPAPKVNSAIIKLTTLRSPTSKSLEVGLLSERDFFRLVRIAFAQKRKMLKKNLANGYHVEVKKAETWLEQAGFSLNIRAQELSIKDWLALLSIIYSDRVAG